MEQSQSKHREEMIRLKSVYEEKLKIVDKDCDEKQRQLYDNKSELTVLEMQKQQLTKDKERLEREVKTLKDSEKSLQ